MEMDMVRCPSCRINLTAQEAAGKTCPICGDSLASLRSSTAPQINPPLYDETLDDSLPEFDDSATADAGGSVDLPRIDVSTSTSSRRASSGSGLFSHWWIILLAIFAFRACTSIMNSYDSRPQPTHYDFQEPSIDEESIRLRQEEIDRIIKQAQERQRQDEFDSAPTIVDE